MDTIWRGAVEGCNPVNSIYLPGTRLIFNSYPNSSNDPNELWSDFKTKFLTIADKHAPIKQRRVKSEFKPWITNEIRRLSYHRDYLKRQAIRLRSVYYETAYKKCKNKVTNLIRTSKESYFSPN